MDRCALFVDASYALADGAMAVHGTRRRDSVSWNHAGLLTLLAGLAKDRTGLPVLRCYWYELAAGDARTAEQDALAEMPGLKLRLVNSRPGRREGIEGQLRRDLVTLAKSNGIIDAFIVSADDHLAEIVTEVQDLGVRVVVLHISTDGGWTIPQPLRQECDDIVEISGVHLRPFVELVRGAEPPALSDAYGPGHADQRGAEQLAASIGYPGPAPAQQQAPAAVSAASQQAQQAMAAPDAARAGGGQQAGPGYDAAFAPPPVIDQAQAAANLGQAGPQYPQAMAPGASEMPEPHQSSMSAHRDGLGPAGVNGGHPQLADGVIQNGVPHNGIHHTAVQQNGIPNSAGNRGGAPHNGVAPYGGQRNGTGQHGAPEHAAPAALQYDPANPGHVPGGYRFPDQEGGHSGSPAAPSFAPNGAAPGGPPAASPPPGRSSQGGTPAGRPPQVGALPGGIEPNGAAPSSGMHGARPAGYHAAPPGQHHHHGYPGPGVAMPTPMPAPPMPGPPMSAGPMPGNALHSTPVQPPGPMNPLQGVPAFPPQQPYHAPALRQPQPLPQMAAVSLPDAVKAAHAEGYAFGESVGRDAPGLWLEAVLARKPRMPSDLEARLLQGSALPIDSLLHDEVRHSLRRGFWDALEGARR